MNLSVRSFIADICTVASRAIKYILVPRWVCGSDAEVAVGGCSRRRAAHLFALYSAFTASLKPLPKEKVGTIVAARAGRRRRQRTRVCMTRLAPFPSGVVRGGFLS